MHLSPYLNRSSLLKAYRTFEQAKRYEDKYKDMLKKDEDKLRHAKSPRQTIYRTPYKVLETSDKKMGRFSKKIKKRRFRIL